jgi:dienelactone hydrolase
MAPADRRTLLRALASGGAVLLAGCGGGETAPTTDDATTRPPTDATAAPTSAATTTGATPDEGTPTDEETPAPPDDAALRETAEAVVSRMADGEFEAARESFDTTMREQVAADDLEDIWVAFRGEKGPFVGIVDTAVTTVSGYRTVVVTVRYTDGRTRFGLLFDDRGQVAGIRPAPAETAWSPPAYADESAFTESERSIRATDSCTLGATLTMPTGEEFVPGVVLVHGSGPSDRDGTVGPNKPYKDLAWGLASRGIAVLRYEKRTAACRIEGTLNINEEVTDDALAAAELLRDENRVSDGDVIVAGHSLGGMLAPRIATEDPGLAGIVMLAAPARPLPEVLVDQYEYLANLDGTVTEMEGERLDEVRTAVDRIESGDVGQEETVLGASGAYWNSLLAYDPTATADALGRPAFVLQGERDYQVTVEDDLTEWRVAFADNADARIEQYPSLNHLFMPGEGQPTPAEYYEPNHVAESVVADLASWVDDTVDVAQ